MPTSLEQRATPPLTVMHLASGDLWAGAEVQLYTLSRELQKRPDINLHVVLLNEGKLADILRNEGIETTVFDENKLSGFEILSKLRKLVKQIQPNIIHTHRQKENVLGSIAALFQRGCKSVRTVHGDSEHNPKLSSPHKFLFYLLDKWSGLYLQKNIISVSDELSQKLNSTFPKDKIATIYNGVDSEYVKKESEAFSPHLPGKTSRIKIGIFARLVPVKRLDLFVNIAQEISKQRPDEFQFYIFGDGPLKQEISSQISAKELSNDVFMMGHVDNALPYIRTMDAILITSDHEGLPMSLLEAVVSATPVISPKLGGPSSVLSGFTPSLLVDQRTPNDYLQVLDNISQEGFGKIGEKLSAFLDTTYLSSTNANLVTKIYRGEL